jgi:hypothetical protein
LTASECAPSTGTDYASWQICLLVVSMDGAAESHKRYEERGREKDREREMMMKKKNMRERDKDQERRR